MTQKELVSLALTGIKAKQIALMNGISQYRDEKPYVLEALQKAQKETFPIRRELEEMIEAEKSKEQPDMFCWVNEALDGLKIRG